MVEKKPHTHTHTEATVDYYERLLTIAKRKFKVAR